jgi:hypothetical protein
MIQKFLIINGATRMIQLENERSFTSFQPDNFGYKIAFIFSASYPGRSGVKNNP